MVYSGLSIYPVYQDLGGPVETCEDRGRVVFGPLISSDTIYVVSDIAKP